MLPRPATFADIALTTASGGSSRPLRPQSARRRWPRLGRTGRCDRFRGALSPPLLKSSVHTFELRLMTRIPRGLGLLRFAVSFRAGDVCTGDRIGEPVHDGLNIREVPIEVELDRGSADPVALAGKLLKRKLVEPSPSRFLAQRDHDRHAGKAGRRRNSGRVGDLYWHRSGVHLAYYRSVRAAIVRP